MNSLNKKRHNHINQYHKCVSIFGVSTAEFRKKWLYLFKKPCDICGRYFRLNGWKYGKDIEPSYLWSRYGRAQYENHGHICSECGDTYAVAFCLISLLTRHDEFCRPKTPCLKGYYDE